ncbi:hypothetical protein BRD17_00600 [Halobacteriales archaeon SW_7_68_16]|nr:MAG: hypothetical protein BRD17_00600 [Halobacteriales archaeon SW_7_68_16]
MTGFSFAAAFREAFGVDAYRETVDGAGTHALSAPTGPDRRDRLPSDEDELALFAALEAVEFDCARDSCYEAACTDALASFLSEHDDWVRAAEPRLPDRGAGPCPALADLYPDGPDLQCEVSVDDRPRVGHAISVGAVDIHADRETALTVRIVPDDRAALYRPRATEGRLVLRLPATAWPASTPARLRLRAHDTAAGGRPRVEVGFVSPDRREGDRATLADRSSAGWTVSG